MIVIQFPTQLEVVEPTVKVGDFFYASWGWDQTNIDFYKVVGLTPKGVKIQHWTSATTQSVTGADMVIPGVEAVSGAWVTKDGVSVYERDVEAPVETKRLKSFDAGKFYLHWKSYADLYLWDGAEKYQTAAGYGH